MRARLTSLFVIFGLLTAVLALGRASLAQTSASATITAVNIVITSANNATLSFSYTSSAAAGLRYQVAYGPTTAYGRLVPMKSLADPVGNDSVTISGLNPGTTYHFSIQIFPAAGSEVLTASADRTFTTASGDSSLLIIERIRTDCVDRYCSVYFATTKPATVEVRWDVTSQLNFPTYATGASEATASDAFRSIRIPTDTQIPFNLNTEYHYRLMATGANNATFTTGDLTLTTSSSSSDHVFATGSCTTPGPPAVTVDIGSCLGTQYCSSAGQLIDDCTQCGYVCPTRPVPQTCRSGAMGGECQIDTPLNGAPTQCNESSCYDSKGNFISPAAARCSSSWPRCNANTILKVRNDRGCNLWLTCATSIQTDASASGPGENLCLNLGACNSLNTKGQCNRYLPLGQCNNDPLRFCNADTDCQGGGSCNNPDPSAPTKALQTLTYQAPADVAKVADLSGNVAAGLDWGQQGGANVIQGQLPWQLMRQIGGETQIKNGDFEYRAPEADPWSAVPAGVTPPEAVRVDFEDRDSGPNHVLVVEPITQSLDTKLCFDTVATNTNILDACTADSDCRPAGNTTAICKTGGKCTDSVVANNVKINSPCTEDAQCRPSGNTSGTCSSDVKFSGAASNAFIAAPSEYYYAEARIKADGGNPVVRMQFGHGGYTKFSVNDKIQVCSNDLNRACSADSECVAPGTCSSTKSVTTNSYVDVPTTSAWQRVTIGPIRGMSGATRLAFVCADKASCGKFQVDDVIVKPILQVNTNPNYITPSCRLYPKNDSPSCDYADPNGIVYKGWKGYCLERDSQTGTCLSWWPVDIIKGESSIFGSEKTAGYQDRAPLFLCAESAGYPVNSGYSSGYYQEMATNIQAKICGDSDLDECNSQFSCVCSPIVSQLSGGSTCGNPGSTKGICVKSTGLALGNAYPPLGSDTQVNVQDLYFVELNFQNQIGGNSWPGTVKITQDTAANGGCGGNYSGQPWSICIEGGNPADWLAVRFEFDSTTGFLKYIHAAFDDGTSGAGGLWYKARFLMKEKCSKLVQVVNSSGQNSSFAGRINSPTYKVPDLNYSLKTDLTPYGGALQPQTSDNPSDWPLLSAEQPNYTNFQPPGQARSGSPYACNGPCTDVICTADNTTCLESGVISQAKVRTCQQKDINQDGTPDGECVGVTSNAASTKGPQLFSSTLSTGDSYFAQERIKRLFAQSYGIWNYSGGKYTLVPNSEDPDAAAFVGWKPPAIICPLNPAYKSNACT
ncbi:MAG: fibronectin type III domain-containing protein, partial [Patescibacteria group bacterium]